MQKAAEAFDKKHSIKREEKKILK